MSNHFLCQWRKADHEEIATPVFLFGLFAKCSRWKSNSYRRDRKSKGEKEMASAHCFENAPALNPTGGGGEVVDDFVGQKAYITGSPESKAAVILVSDAFGFEAPNLRKIADKVASCGFFVVVPDFLHGDPYDPNNPNNPGMWLQAHDPTMTVTNQYENRLI